MEQPKQRRRRETFRGTPRFRRLGKLGEGGMGVVYEVFDRDRNIRLALKGLQRMSAERLLQFKDEFRTLRDLHHPNLVSLGELIEEQGEWFFTMEVVDGSDFLSYVRGATSSPPLSTFESTPQVNETRTSVGRHGAEQGRGHVADTVQEAPSSVETVDSRSHQSGSDGDHGTSGGPRGGAYAPARHDEARLRDALVQLARGLSSLHRAGKVHRDIKPSNIRVSHEGRVVLLDFGVAAEATVAAADLDRIVGTAAYMSPEQAAGDGCGIEADWYAVGTLLYQVLAGHLPYTGEHRDVLTRKGLLDPPPLDEMAPDAPADLVALCRRLMARAPADRPAAAEVLEALGATGEDEWLAAFALDSRDDRVFVGRAAELAALGEALGDIRAGGAAVVALEGPSGIGKSHTARRFLELLGHTDRRMIALRGRCHEQESVPYRAFDGLIDELGKVLRRMRVAKLEQLVPPTAGSLVKLFPTLETVPYLSRLAGEHAPSGDSPQELRHQAFGALRTLLARLAGRRAVVLLIDDVQWADADSVALLTSLLSPPAPPPLMLIMTARTVADEPCAAVEAAGPLARRVRMSGLPEADARQLIEHLTGAAPGAALETLLADTGGHPMFLEEIVRHGHGAGGGTRSLEEALRARVSRLDPSARRLLEIVVTGGTIAQDVCVRAARITSEEYARQLIPLRAGALVRISGARRQDKIEPYHDRIRESIYDQIATDRRRALHGALAVELERAGAPPEVLAVHFARAGKRSRALACYERAAQNAARALAFDQAAELYLTAIALVRDDEDHHRQLLTARAACLADAGRSGEAAPAFLLAAELPGTSADEAFALRVDAAAQFMAGGHMEQGAETVRAVLEEVGLPYPRTYGGALASALWADLRLRMSSLRWKSRPPAAVPTSLHRRLDVLWSVGSGLSYIDSIRAWRYTALAPFVAMRAGDAHRIARAMCTASYNQAVVGRDRAARRMIDAARRAAELDPQPHTQFYARAAELGHLFWIENDWDHTLEVAEECTALWRSAGRGAGFEADVLETFACWSLQNLGRLRDAQARVGRLVDRSRRAGNRLLEVSFRAYLSSLALLDDDPDLVDTEAEAALAAWSAQGAYTVQHYWRVVARSRAALYRGRVESVADELEELWASFDRSMLSRLAMVRLESSMTRGGLYLARALETNDPAHRRAMQRKARAHARRLRKSPLPVGRPLAMWIEAALAFQRGRHDESAALLEAIRAAFDIHKNEASYASVTYHLARLRGGSEGERLLAESARWFERERVRNPARIVAMFAAGWPHPG
jgi:eukaryotic-like serine/threonine-protein kinase